MELLNPVIRHSEKRRKDIIMKKRKIFSEFITLVSSVFVLLVLLEFSLRIFLPNSESRGHTKEAPPIYYRLKPNYSCKGYYKTNSHQFRGEWYAERKPTGLKRILLYGDSVTFGWALKDDQIFPS